VLLGSGPSAEVQVVSRDVRAAGGAPRAYLRQEERQGARSGALDQRDASAETKASQQEEAQGMGNKSWSSCDNPGNQGNVKAVGSKRKKLAIFLLCITSI